MMITTKTQKMKNKDYRSFVNKELVVLKQEIDDSNFQRLYEVVNDSDPVNITVKVVSEVPKTKTSESKGSLLNREFTAEREHFIPYYK